MPAVCMKPIGNRAMTGRVSGAAGEEYTMGCPGQSVLTPGAQSQTPGWSVNIRGVSHTRRPTVVKGFGFREKSERNVLHSNGGSICKADLLIIFYSLPRKVCTDGTLGQPVINVSTHISLSFSVAPTIVKSHTIIMTCPPTKAHFK